MSSRPIEHREQRTNGFRFRFERIGPKPFDTQNKRFKDAEGDKVCYHGEEWTVVGCTPKMVLIEKDGTKKKVNNDSVKRDASCPMTFKKNAENSKPPEIGKEWVGHDRCPTDGTLANHRIRKEDTRGNRRSNHGYWGPDGCQCTPRQIEVAVLWKDRCWWSKADHPSWGNKLTTR